MNAAKARVTKSWSGGDAAERARAAGRGEGTERRRSAPHGDKSYSPYNKYAGTGRDDAASASRTIRGGKGRGDSAERGARGAAAPRSEGFGARTRSTSRRGLRGSRRSAAWRRLWRLAAERRVARPSARVAGKLARTRRPAR